MYRLPFLLPLLLLGVLSPLPAAEQILTYAPASARAAVITVQVGEKKHPIAGALEATVAPGGESLLLVVQEKSGRVLYRSDLAGKERRKLPLPGSEVYGALWAPDGQHFACNVFAPRAAGGGSRWEVALSAAEGGEIYLLTKDLPGDNSFHLAGWNFATGEPLVQDLQLLYQMRADGTVAWQRPLRDFIGEAGADSSCRYWILPDGGTLIGNREVVEDEIANMDGPSSFLIRASLREPKPERISPKGLHVGDPFLTFEGDAVLFQGFTKADLKRGKGDHVDLKMRLYRLSLADGQVKPVVQDAWRVTASRRER